MNDRPTPITPTDAPPASEDSLAEKMGSVVTGADSADHPAPSSAVSRSSPTTRPPSGGDAEPAGASGAAEADLVARRDRILIERARDGDLDAFNELVLAYQDHLWALVARLVPDPDQANDAVQEAFFSAYRNLGSYRGGSVRSWLSRMAINAAMDLQRARRRRPASPYPELEDEGWQPPAGPASDPEATALAAERSRALAEALARITPDQRAAIVLYDVEGYDYAEIAELTGVSLGTVKSRIHRGRLALRQLLEGRLDLFRGGR